MNKNQHNTSEITKKNVVQKINSSIRNIQSTAIHSIHTHTCQTLSKTRFTRTIFAQNAYYSTFVHQQSGNKSASRLLLIHHGLLGCFDSHVLTLFCDNSPLSCVIYLCHFINYWVAKDRNLDQFVDFRENVNIIFISWFWWIKILLWKFPVGKYNYINFLTIKNFE